MEKKAQEKLVKGIEVCAVILAAGEGRRMGAGGPKVLRLFHKKPILHWVLDHLQAAGLKKLILVLAKDLSPFASTLRSYPNLFICQQAVRNGTAAALAVTAAFFGQEKPAYAQGGPSQAFIKTQLHSSYILVVTGDSPALSPSLLKDFIHYSLKEKSDLVVLGAELENPFGYGRLIFDKMGTLQAITEEKDLSSEQKNLKACHSGVMLAKKEVFFKLLSAIDCKNTQSEFYLTDCVAAAQKKAFKVSAYLSKDSLILRGINTPEQLKELEEAISPVL